MTSVDIERVAVKSAVWDFDSRHGALFARNPHLIEVMVNYTHLATMGEQSNFIDNLERYDIALERAIENWDGTGFSADGTI